MKVKFHQLAIDDTSSVQKLKDFLTANYGGLDVLINNAGFAFSGDSTAPVSEQAETTVGINFFATRSVCNALFPLLKQNGRAVNVSSAEGQLSKITSEELKSKFKDSNLTEDQLLKLVNQYLIDVHEGTYVSKGWPRSTYQMSKLALTALTFIQQRKFNEDPDKDLVVNAVHPGYVETDMSSHRGTSKPDQGAVAPVYCALLPPNVSSPRGELVYDDCSVVAWE